jgi:hypothetical protein
VTGSVRNSSTLYANHEVAGCSEGVRDGQRIVTAGAEYVITAIYRESMAWKRYSGRCQPEFDHVSVYMGGAAV